METTAILDLPEVRARVHRWTVQDYVELAEENPAFRHSELIRGLIVEKTSKSSLHIVPCACVEGSAVPVETWFA